MLLISTLHRYSFLPLACRILDKIFKRRVKHAAMPTTPADTLNLLLALPRDVVLEVRLYMIFLNNMS
jgi:hypothetical protein